MSVFEEFRCEAPEASGLGEKFVVCHRFQNYRAVTVTIALGLTLSFSAAASYAGSGKAKTAVKVKAPLAAAIDPCRLLTKADAKKVLGAPVTDAKVYHDVGVPGTRCSYFTSAPIAEAGWSGVVSVEVYDMATFKRKGSYFKSPENYFYRSRDALMSTSHHGVNDVSTVNAVGEAAFWQPGPGLLNVLDRGVYLVLSVHANFHIPLGPGEKVDVEEDAAQLHAAKNLANHVVLPRLEKRQ